MTSINDRVKQPVKRVISMKCSEGVKEYVDEYTIVGNSIRCKHCETLLAILPTNKLGRSGATESQVNHTIIKSVTM